MMESKLSGYTFTFLKDFNKRVMIYEIRCKNETFAIHICMVKYRCMTKIYCSLTLTDKRRQYNIFLFVL